MAAPKSYGTLTKDGNTRDALDRAEYNALRYEGWHPTAATAKKVAASKDPVEKS